jgi:hypothetical protein
MATAAPTARPTPAGNLLRRRRVDRLSRRRVAALRQAFAESQATTSERGYEYWAGIYGLPQQLAPHRSPLFLPWRRAYLLSFERSLQDHVPGVSLPWWDWTAQHEIPEAFAVDQVEAGRNPLAHGQRRDGVTHREPGPPDRLPPPAVVRDLLASEDFLALSQALETLHDQVHAWVGGDMAQVGFAAYDPLFWPLTAMVDRIWWMWQQQHADSEIDPELLAVGLAPFDLRVGDVLDTTALGYEYDAGEPWSRALPGYTTDAIADVPVDHLGVEDDVEALCQVVAANDVKPPLSIGLFGDWGTGKSTFMGLMRERIDELAERSRAPDVESAFTGHVKQITFNAWHYADDNLWASLVTHIFEELGVPETFEGEQARAAPPSGLLGTIASERLATQATIDEADRREEQAQKAIADLPDTPHELAREAVSSPVVPGLADDEVVKSARADVVAAVGQPAAKALDDVVQSTSTLMRLANRLRALREMARRGQPGRRRVLLSVAVMAVGLLALVILPLFGLDLASIGAAAATVAGIASVVNQLLSAEQTVSSAVDRIEHHVEDERQQAEQVIKDAQATRAHAEERRSEIASGMFVREYFAQRAASADYRSRLGLISTVRRDFEDLRTWLNKVRELPEDERAAFPEIERVVLYVDDLDRCATRRVVEVLEAVHLLLALDLFVVVVGVDPRWLLSSLERHYSAQFAPRSSSAGSRALWTTTPQNYLEKIFQIPFNLRPMDPDGFNHLVTSLLPLRAPPGDGDGPHGEGRPPAPPTHAASGASGPAPPPPPPPAGDAGDVPPVDDDLNPAGLTVEPHELEFLSTLSGLVPTPRATKRLVNTYRLLRAPLDEPSLRRLVDDQYGVVLTLLAVMVGFPDIARRLFEGLLAEDPDMSWPDFGEKLKTVSSSGPNWPRVAHELSKVALSDPLLPFQQWVPIVARYSFETSRLVPTPL